ncbi:uncharacterized protein EV420DRAFT_1140288 [Desarmillaria tabescens]|uniref:Uncharacterized protein n=1 Tax=Armillaria tabescens TaxID=1929756 RepID=A0AA39NC19_ARMTA|nr:uncharacterized protein EV420DRAFT_1140288 [Desarmillaria tabescens]KAK0462831.1 hypothetical protein EV420DRAFT_1140288 [Desarmillaria tabescens]
MPPVTPLFNLAVIAPSSFSPSNAIETVQRAYRAVFGRDVLAEDSENHLLLWTQICSSPGVPDSVVEEIREVLPYLPDITWRSVARVVGLDPSQGNEQLPVKPTQTLYLSDKFVDELLYNARWIKYRHKKRKYVQLGSFAVKAVLDQMYFAREVFVDESCSEFEVKIVRNAALLMMESERWPNQTQILAQAIAEVTFV